MSSPQRAGERRRVVCFVHHDADYDSRVYNGALSLRDGGYQVEVCAEERQADGTLAIEEELAFKRLRLASRGWQLPRVLRVLEYQLRAIGRYAREDIDVAHCHDLPTLPIGVALAALSRHRVSVIYDAHEYEVAKNGLHGFNKVLHEIAERLLIHSADRVVTVSDTIGDEYARLYSIPKPAIVLNCPPKDETRRVFDLFREELGIRKDQTIFLYQGLFATGRGIEILIDAFSRFTSDECVVVFMGFGDLEEEIIAAARKHPTVFHHEAVFPPKLLDYTASADYGISFIQDVSLSDRYCLPNKLFEYISVGLPVICSNLPEMRRFVEKHEIGVAATSNTVDGVMEAVRKTLTMNSQKLRENVLRAREEYNWETQAKVLLGLYRNLSTRMRQRS